MGFWTLLVLLPSLTCLVGLLPKLWESTIPASVHRSLTLHCYTFVRRSGLQCGVWAGRKAAPPHQLKSQRNFLTSQFNQKRAWIVLAQRLSRVRTNPVAFYRR